MDSVDRTPTQGRLFSS